MGKYIKEIEAGNGERAFEIDTLEDGIVRVRISVNKVEGDDTYYCVGICTGGNTVRDAEAIIREHNGEMMDWESSSYMRMRYINYIEEALAEMLQNK